MNIVFLDFLCGGQVFSSPINFTLNVIGLA
jgi:hypothetical protein